ncbi:MAG: 50S ribosomal protein L15 [Candidatus Omnitrophica bacterium]|nr:50S ribosomal protein L15 [Candidatus Omnitrophota bacterium]
MSIIDYMVLPKGAKKKRRRRGRGQGSGMGKTSGRGHKGQTARGKTKKSKGFEGGQMPLLRRVPKRGFTSIFKRQYQIVNIDRMQHMKSLPKDNTLTPELMEQKGLIKSSKLSIKVLGDGELKKELIVHAHAFSKSAKGAIEKAGGKAVLIQKKTQEKAKVKKARVKVDKKQFEKARVKVDKKQVEQAQVKEKTDEKQGK